MKPTRKEYIDAAKERIKNWCQDTKSEIDSIVWISIQYELETMFEVGKNYDPNT